ncbi:MAG: M81 family metallopeptidase, partial [Alphaproteobacteria bacterium]|nr:M81 family metallopeptidase [Alphaproteobacteria bacterium]
RGEAIFDTFATNTLPIAGFIREAGKRGHAMVPLGWAMAVPCGRVTDDAFERIAAMIVNDLAGQTPVDAVYLDLHGAAVTDSFEDAEGELLRRVRSIVGPDTVIAASLDLHANVTELMVQQADLITAYRTYPHIDTAETGSRAAVLLDEWLKGKKRPGKALRQLPFLIPLTAQCSLAEPCRGIYDGFAAIEQATGATLSFTPGFPPADIHDCGPAVFAYAPDQARADQAADAVLRQLLDAEAAFGDEILAPDVGVARAIDIARGASRPVVLADTQDNPGAGGSSDTVGLLEALVAGGARGAVLALLYDPDSAATAYDAGVGAEVELALGGKNQMPGHRPFRGRFVVKAIGDGNFTARGKMLDGAAMQLGKTALVRYIDDNSEVDVIVGSARQQPYTLSIFHHVGVDPTRQKIVAVKSSVHFRAAFQDIAEQILVVAAPGVNLADPRDFTYAHLRPGVKLRPGG